VSPIGWPEGVLGCVATCERDEHEADNVGDSSFSASTTPFFSFLSNWPSTEVIKLRNVLSLMMDPRTSAANRGRSSTIIA
jgi:hypothetical protein